VTRRGNLDELQPDSSHSDTLMSVQTSGSGEDWLRSRWPVTQGTVKPEHMVFSKPPVDPLQEATPSPAKVVRPSIVVSRGQRGGADSERAVEPCKLLRGVASSLSEATAEGGCSAEHSPQSGKPQESIQDER
jgi:hypothetical protein